MIFESKYRRQAMAQWENEKAETKKELVEDLENVQNKLTNWKLRTQDVVQWVFSSRKDHPNKRFQ